jgi:hypothetical protein
VRVYPRPTADWRLAPSRRAGRRLILSTRPRPVWLSHLRNLLRCVERVDEIITSILQKGCDVSMVHVRCLIWSGEERRDSCRQRSGVSMLVHAENRQRGVYHSISVSTGGMTRPYGPRQSGSVRIVVSGVPSGKNNGKSTVQGILALNQPDGPSIWSLFPAPVPVPTALKRTSSLATGAGRPGHSERSRETAPSAWVEIS